MVLQTSNRSLQQWRSHDYGIGGHIDICGSNVLTSKEGSSCQALLTLVHFLQSHATYPTLTKKHNGFFPTNLTTGLRPNRGNEPLPPPWLQSNKFKAVHKTYSTISCNCKYHESERSFLNTINFAFICQSKITTHIHHVEEIEDSGSHGKDTRINAAQQPCSPTSLISRQTNRKFPLIHCIIITRPPFSMPI